MLDSVFGVWNAQSYPRYNASVLQRTGESESPYSSPRRTGRIRRNNSPIRRSWWRSLAEVVVMLLIIIGAANFLLVDCTLIGMGMSPAWFRTSTSGQSHHVLAVNTSTGRYRGATHPLNPVRLQVRRVIGLPVKSGVARSAGAGRRSPLTESYIGNRWPSARI